MRTVAQDATVIQVATAYPLQHDTLLRFTRALHDNPVVADSQAGNAVSPSLLWTYFSALRRSLPADGWLQLTRAELPELAAYAWWALQTKHPQAYRKHQSARQRDHRKVRRLVGCILTEQAVSALVFH